ncbi:ABC transporter substrate-binding protein [Ruegeria sp. EL01]|uniref:ABC transporter substrate-binding protein n=1 Tax=Ruegeria sp. EL01 TaxID=2107578 RepID=UPI000EA80193|nr:ABC transporter substrate-binding protein [Ruegeria sp. EL01]
MKIKPILKTTGSTLALCATAIVGAAGTAAAEEEFTVTMLSVSVYGPWFIAKEKGMADGVDINVKIIEDITARNAGLVSGSIQCMMTTMDSTVVTAAANVPVKHVAVPLMSYGLDEMVVDGAIQSEADLAGKTYAADYGFLNHMWMLLTLKKNGIPFDGATHSIMLPQDATAAFSSGALDVDVNFIPFSTQSAERKGAHILKSTFTDKTYERGLVSDSIACSTNWLEEKPDVAREVIRAWFEAVDWWKQNPAEGNAIIAKGLDWPEEDVRLTQAGAVMLTIDQNKGALGLGDGKPLCESIPAEAPQPDGEPSGWGVLVGKEVDCEAGYLADTWDLFSNVYHEAGVADATISAGDGIDSSIIEWLDSEGYDETYSNNNWVGRLPI